MPDLGNATIIYVSADDIVMQGPQGLCRKDVKGLPESILFQVMHLMQSEIMRREHDASFEEEV